MCGDGMGPMGPGPGSGGPGGPPNGGPNGMGDTMDVLKTSPGHDPGTPREDPAVMGDFNMGPYGNGENVGDGGDQFKNFEFFN